MPRFGQVVVAVLTASVACAGGAAAIGNVTGVSPMVLLRPSSATSMEVLTVANIRSVRVPSFAPADSPAVAPEVGPAVARPTTDATPPRPAHSEPAVEHTATASPSASVPTPTPVRPKPNATASAPAVVSPTPSSGTSSNVSTHDDDDHDKPEKESHSGEDAEDD